MSKLLAMSELNLKGKKVLIREDLNVPMHDGKITNDARIQRALPTIKQVISQGASVILLSHLGRPTEGEADEHFSLAPVAEALSIALGQSVMLVTDWLDGLVLEPGQVVLCENVRFNKGEKNNDPELAKRLAHLCDVFVMDAFATAHRAQASTTGVVHFAPVACAGPLLLAELDALQQVANTPEKPLIAIVGGSKVSTKINLLDVLLEKVDTLIAGGGIANTLLAAAGYNIGKSLYEADKVEWCKMLLEKAKSLGVTIPLPLDVTVATEFSANAKAQVKLVTAVSDDEMILDVGPETMKTYEPLMAEAATILWNGPVGVFEFPAFAAGTKALGEAIATSDAYSLAGGGDTVAAIEQFGITDRISYVSTGGGAFLEFIQGIKLPAVVALEERVNHHA